MNGHKEWLKFRQSVLDEPNQEERLARIEQAERAVKRELRNCMQEGLSVSSDRWELESALHKLKELREEVNRSLS